MRKVMVFGVFDGLHDGHRAFLREAKNCGDYLIVVVARDETVEFLKNRKPRLSLAKRLQELRQEKNVDEVVAGDSKLGTWEVIKKHKPVVIALGYDQELLKKELVQCLKDFDWQPEVKVMKAHQPEKYHSSMLNSNNSEPLTSSETS